MKKQDLVSIIIPTYNRELYYISRAVKSIQQQTYKHYEIIIVDDNTDTSTYSLQIKKYCKSNGILYLKLMENREQMLQEISEPLIHTGLI